MQIKYKLIEHERTEDAPFVGALISAISCRFKCEDCFNKHLRKQEIKKADVKDLIQEVKANPFNEGIILGGLEWSFQPKELVALVTEAHVNNLKVMIYTGCDFQEFYEKIGKAHANTIAFKNLLKHGLVDKKDKNLNAIMGKIIMDYSIPADYYIKCGRYDKTQKSTDRVHFGVDLASENQNIYLIRKVED